MSRQPIIRCPRCSYRPRVEDRWACVPQCGTLWHTFWTAGICPGCARQWHETQCPACTRHSPHKRWYRLPHDPTPERSAEPELVQGA